MENYNFEVGKTYEFDVLDLIENSIGAKKLLLKYGEKTTFKCTPFPFQEEELPSVVYCKVIKLDPANNLPILRQDKAKFFQENYPNGDYAFRIVDILPDENIPQKHYYKLEDHFGLIYRCYFKGEPEFKPGEVKSFEVTGIDEEKEHLCLKTISYASQKKLVAATPKTYFSNADSEFGPESQTVEHKTSIVFTPGNSEANIDEQLPKIIRVIASFLNTDGGCLNIGVNDAGQKVGMENDYAHLNDGDDKFNGSYKPNTEGYKLKIINAVRRYLGERAAMMLTFEFPEKYGGTVCRIDVKPAKRPVFFNRAFLFVRLDCETAMLKDDQITSFVQERLDTELTNIINPDALKELKLTGDVTLQNVEELIKKYITKQPIVIPPSTSPVINVAPAVTPTPPANDEVWNHFTYYKNGEYSIQKNASSDADVLMQVCVHKSEKNQRILLCYANGYVVNVEPAKIYDSKYRGKRRKNGWNTKDQLLNIFVANTFDLLAAVSTDLHGQKFIKAHNVSDLGKAVQNMASQGNMFVSPKLGVVDKFIFVPTIHRQVIPNLILHNSETSTSLGIPITSQKYLNEIHYLQNIK